MVCCNLEYMPPLHRYKHLKTKQQPSWHTSVQTPFGSNRATGTPLPGQPTSSAFRNCASQSPRYSRRSYFCKMRTMVKAMDVMAKFCPMQMRGPPLNGTNCHGFGVQCSHRSGLKMAGCAKVSDTGGYKSARRCIARVLYTQTSPLKTAMSGSPAGVGRNESSTSKPN